MKFSDVDPSRILSATPHPGPEDAELKANVEAWQANLEAWQKYQQAAPVGGHAEREASQAVADCQKHLAAAQERLEEARLWPRRWLIVLKS